MTTLELICRLIPMVVIVVQAIALHVAFERIRNRDRLIKFLFSELERLREGAK